MIWSGTKFITQPKTPLFRPSSSYLLRQKKNLLENTGLCSQCPRLTLPLFILRSASQHIENQCGAANKAARRTTKYTKIVKMNNSTEIHVIYALKSTYIT